jgi:hypothetical protein
MPTASHVAPSVVRLPDGDPGTHPLPQSQVGRSGVTGLSSSASVAPQNGLRMVTSWLTVSKRRRASAPLWRRSYRSRTLAEGPQKAGERAYLQPDGCGWLALIPRCDVPLLLGASRPHLTLRPPAAWASRRSTCCRLRRDGARVQRGTVGTFRAGAGPRCTLPYRQLAPRIEDTRGPPSCVGMYRDLLTAQNVRASCHGSNSTIQRRGPVLVSPCRALRGPKARRLVRFSVQHQSSGQSSRSRTAARRMPISEPVLGVSTGGRGITVYSRTTAAVVIRDARP